MEFKIKSLSEEFKITGVANVHFFEFDKNFTTDIDKHPFYELVFVSNGKLKVSSEKYSGYIDKGSMIIHKPNELHSLASDEKSSPTVIIMGFTCVGMPEQFCETPLVLNEPNIKKLAEAVKEGRNVFAPPHNVPVYDMKKNKNQVYGSEQMLKISIEHFFISLIRERFIAPNSETLTSKFNVNEIIAYLNDKYKEKITISELAFIFNTNRTTLCKEFKKATNSSILEYVNQIKLDRAKRKIIETNANFTEISNELNFESIHYFTKFFKKKTGVTPKEFRLLYRIK